MINFYVFNVPNTIHYGKHTMTIMQTTGILCDDLSTATIIVNSKFGKICKILFEVKNVEESDILDYHDLVIGKTK